MEHLSEKDWHHLSQNEVIKCLASDAETGIDATEIKQRQTRFGYNRLTPQKAKNPFILFFLQFHQPLVYILLVASLITLVLQEWVDSGVIFGVILVNAIIGFLQESKALKAIEALTHSMESFATVVRNGKKEEVAASELVPGDIVLLKSGDKVPADLYLLQCRELQIDESTLTGESVPVQKSTGSLTADTLLAERNNLSYSSTLVTYGSAKGIVIATGDYTEIGRINTLIANADILATPLTKKIAQFSKALLWIILVLASLSFVAGWFHGQPLLDSFMAAVALMVGAIPEGLPAAMTIMLAIGVNLMANRNAIIRKMPAVETLGSTTVICSDKTGTLTENQMTVLNIYTAEKSYEVTGLGYNPEGSIQYANTVVDAVDNPLLIECLAAGLLCNDSQLINKEGQWLVEGDPTEAALISSAAKAKVDQQSSIQRFPRIDALPFESQHQYMATLHEMDGDNRQLIYIKGSVESILSRCNASLDGQLNSQPLLQDKILEEVENYAEKGLRVLAFARKILTQKTDSIDHESLKEGLVFIGLQAMMDPPREEAVKAVATCQRAGIQVKMITGDHVATASAIARKIGLENYADGEQFALNGHDLSELPDSLLADAAQSTTVFARVTPEQKLRLVRALQSKGHVVAMTGDGVNDAPALKQADIGIAMGMGGTEVAKEAADMLLTDDNFATIEAAIEEGRTVFDNLVKFITWTLPTNVGEGLVILVAVFFGLTLPVTPVQILWINMTTALLLGLMLAFEEKEPGIMSRPPRRPNMPILTTEINIRIGIVSTILLLGAFGLFEWAQQQGKSLETARTIAVNMFVFGELFYLFNCRSLRYSIFQLGFFSNKWLLFGVIAMILLQLFFTYSPLMNTLFHTAPLDLTEWSMILASALLIYLAVDIDKRRYKHK